MGTALAIRIHREDRMHSPDKTPSFSHYLLLFIVFLIMIGVLGVTLVDYLNAERNFQDNEKRLENLTEKNFQDAVLLVDAGLNLYDDTLNRQMEQGFIIFLEEYERSERDPARMDLEAVKGRINATILSRVQSRVAGSTGGNGGYSSAEDATMDLYIINSSGIIEYTTWAPESGLDFRAWPYFYSYLTQIRQSEGFFPDRVVRESGTGKFRKFAYMPTSDHQYILELGLAGQIFDQERSRLDYQRVITTTMGMNPYLERVRIFDSKGDPEVLSQTPVTGDSPAVIQQVIASRSSLESHNEQAGTKTKYLFIDLKNERYGSDPSRVIELTYNTALIRKALNDLVLFHLAVAVLVLFIGSGIAVVVSRHITRPITAIVADVDTIARGDLDHRISPTRGGEFAVLEKSINSMVHELKETVTRVQESEVKLRYSEARYRAVVESQSEMISRFLPDGTHIFANDAYCRYFGTTCEDLIGKKFFSRIPDEEQTMLRDHFASLSPQKPDARIEHRIRLPDGSVRWQQWSDLAIFDARGVLLEFQSVGRDITDAKRAEEALRKSEEKYRELVQNAHSIILRLDPEGKITFFNEFAQKFFGYTRAEILGKSVIGTIVPSVDRAGKDLGSMISVLIENPEHFSVIENENVCSNGERVWISWTSKPILDGSGNVAEILCVGSDLTERKRAEEKIRTLNEELEHRVAERTRQLRAVNNDLESFTYSVSHDLRGPLRAIDGFSQILLQEHSESLTNDAQEYLRKVRANTQKMAHLIDALLNFSRMGRQSLTKETVQPSDLVAQVIEELSEEQKGRSVEFHIGELPRCIADPALLRQVYFNLIANALKFSRNREHAVIEVSSTHEGSRTVYFVRDNGIGFNQQYAHKLFGVFQRLHSSAEYGGTGVGLAIVQKIIERHNGTIWAHGEVDKGATFYFTLDGEQGEGGQGPENTGRIP